MYKLTNYTIDKIISNLCIKIILSKKIDLALLVLNPQIYLHIYNF